MRMESCHYRVTGRERGQTTCNVFKPTCFLDGQSIDDAERFDFNFQDFLTDLLMGDLFLY